MAEVPPPRPRAPAEQVDAGKFYGTWSGHDVPDLVKVHEALRECGRPLVFFAGDSSLDNKHWVQSPPGRPERPAFWGLETVLRPPLMAPDVAYCLNDEFRRTGTAFSCLNTSIEATCLADRASELLPQDEFIRDHIRAEDVLVVSVGGNDIALRPSASTALAAFKLARLTGLKSVQTGMPTGMGHMVKLFGDTVQRYIEKLVAKTKPRAVVVCMIYFPQVAKDPLGGWADTPLKGLKYNSDPERLQTIIRRIYELATSRIRVDGVRVIPFPLYEAMDGSDPADYVARVEPSAAGGVKIARNLVPVLAETLRAGASAPAGGGAVGTGAGASGDSAGGGAGAGAGAGADAGTEAGGAVDADTGGASRCTCS